MKDEYTIEEFRVFKKKRGSKYHNERTRGFDSKKEAQRFDQLMLLMKAGHIGGLLSQVPFRIEVNGIKICKYIADFTYMENGKYIVEDTKGKRTDVYKLKKKLMLAVHGIEIKET